MTDNELCYSGNFAGDVNNYYIIFYALNFTTNAETIPPVQDILIVNGDDKVAVENQVSFKGEKIDKEYLDIIGNRNIKNNTINYLKLDKKLAECFLPNELENIELNWIVGKFVSFKIHKAIDHKDAQYAEVLVEPGENYLINSREFFLGKAWAIYDVNGFLVDYYPKDSYASSYIQNMIVSIPENGHTLVIHRTNDDARNADRPIFVKKILSFKTNQDEPIITHEDNPLYGKTAIFEGDSIAHGTSVGSDSPYYAWGWAGRIGTKNSMQWHNFAISGGTVCSDTYSYTKVTDTSSLDWSGKTYYIRTNSTSTATLYQTVTQSTWDGTSALYLRGAARHWESTNIDEMY